MQTYALLVLIYTRPSSNLPEAMQTFYSNAYADLLIIILRQGEGGREPVVQNPVYDASMLV